MTPFSYHNPTRIEFALGKENQIGLWFKDDAIKGESVEDKKK